MEFSFDKVADTLYIRFSNEKILTSEEIIEGIIVDYGQNDAIVGIEVLNFTNRKLNLNDLIKMPEEEIIPMITECQ